MATTEATTAARTGEQFLEGLNAGEREIWLDGERIAHPLEHPDLRSAALSMARVFDLQHEHANEMLAPSPDDGRLVNVTHLIPRSREDLERRRTALALTAALSGGMMGRTPDYLNVPFACFAGRSDVWARRGNWWACRRLGPASNGDRAFGAARPAAGNGSTPTESPPPSARPRVPRPPILIERGSAENSSCNRF